MELFVRVLCKPIDLWGVTLLVALAVIAISGAFLVVGSP